MDSNDDVKGEPDARHDHRTEMGLSVVMSWIGVSRDVVLIDVAGRKAIPVRLRCGLAGSAHMRARNPEATDRKCSHVDLLDYRRAMLVTRSLRHIIGTDDADDIPGDGIMVPSVMICVPAH